MKVEKKTYRSVSRGVDWLREYGRELLLTNSVEIKHTNDVNLEANKSEFMSFNVCDI